MGDELILVQYFGLKTIKLIIMNLIRVTKLITKIIWVDDG